MEEIWKDIPGYEGMYKCSNLGNVYSYNSNAKMKARKQNSGYFLLHLNRFGIRKAFTVHRLIASVFVPNPENKPQVNHKNGNKEDNRASNLEWATAKENTNHAFKNGLVKDINKSRSKNMRKIAIQYGEENGKRLIEMNKKLRKPILQLDDENNIVKIWDSGREARRAGFGNINSVLTGKYKKCGGYKWKYAA